MSSVSAAGTSAALPISGFHLHGGHRRGSPVSQSASTDALTDSDASADSAAPATNQSLFSSLLQTAEKIVGVQLTAPTAPTQQTLLKQIQAQSPSGTNGTSLGGRINITA